MAKKDESNEFEQSPSDESDTLQKISEFSQRGREAFDEISERGRQLFEETSHWVRGNSGRLIGVGIGLVAIGALAYFLGRSETETPSNQRFTRGDYH